MVLEAPGRAAGPHPGRLRRGRGAGRPTIGFVRPRVEEEPEPIVVPDEPDEPDEPEVEPEAVATSGTTLVPAVPANVEREYEYRVEVVTNAQVLDGKTLPNLLSEASHDEWHLVEIIDAGDKKAVLLRKRKESKPQRRPVGFMLGS